MVLAALCYSLTTVRIGYFAARLRPLQLALAKSSGLAALAAGTCTLLQPFPAAVGTEHGHSLSRNGLVHLVVLDLGLADISRTSC